MKDERPVVVVTGASSGIGAAVALRLGVAGCRVVATGRDAARLDGTVAAIRAEGGAATAVCLDLTAAAEIEAFAAGFGESHGAVGALVLCAGDADIATVEELSPAGLAAMVDVNLIGAHRLIHALLPAMIERRRGDIVVVSSENVTRFKPMMAAYTASKCALEALAVTMQKELEGTGVRTSIVRPGSTRTAMGSTWAPAELGALFGLWGRWGLARHSGRMDPDHVAQVVEFVLGAPREMNVACVEVQPEAPVASVEEAKTVAAK
nr:SDR family NAD(P)-dependent oxidoreductase [Nocardia sp. GTS18]